MFVDMCVVFCLGLLLTCRPPSADNPPPSRFTVILISRFVIGIREASRRGSGSWASSPSQMSDIKFLSGKLQTFALEDVVPDLVNDDDENWDDNWEDHYDEDDESDVHVLAVGSVGQEDDAA